MRSSGSNGFVADGYARACAGVRAQVESEYAERLKKAAPEEVARLWLQMQRELEARLLSKAPGDGLY